MNKFVIWLIQLYRCTFAVQFGGSCRFFPSCSNYAIEAIQKNGLIKGTFRSAKRILKCHPFHLGGYDPVV